MEIVITARIANINYRYSLAYGIIFALIAVSAAPSVHAGVPGEVVRFETRDGIEIVGDYFAPPSERVPAPGLVLVHMLRVERSSWAPLIPNLHEAGFAVLAIDLRGHGDSGAPQRDDMRRRAREQDVALFHEMHQDVEAAVSWFIGQDEVDKARLGLIGATVGFSVALEYAVRDPSIDVMVGLTPGSGYVGLDSVSATLMYGKRPMLLLAVDTDRRSVETLSRMNPRVVGDIVGKGTGHGTRMLGPYEQTRGQITDFVSEGVGRSGSSPVVFVLGEKQYYTSVDRLKAHHSEFDSKRLRWCSSVQEALNRGLTAASPD